MNKLIKGTAPGKNIFIKKAYTIEKRNEKGELMGFGNNFWYTVVGVGKDVDQEATGIKVDALIHLHPMQVGQNLPKLDIQTILDDEEATPVHVVTEAMILLVIDDSKKEEVMNTITRLTKEQEVVLRGRNEPRTENLVPGQSKVKRISEDEIMQEEGGFMSNKKIPEA